MNLTQFKKQYTGGGIAKPSAVSAGESINGATPPTAKRKALRGNSRNCTFSPFALQMLKKYGDDGDKAYTEYRVKVAELIAIQPKPPISENEIMATWKSALKQYIKIKADPEYIQPQEYAAADFTGSLIPSDFTDIGQARVLVREYKSRLRYSKATKYLFYTGKVWSESEIKAHGAAQDLTERQLRHARLLVRKAQITEDKAAVSGDGTKKDAAKAEIDFAQNYRAYVLARRRSDKIAASLKEAQPMLEIEVDKLDAEAFLLNTPAGTVDLRTGKTKSHDPADYCTKITAVSPGTQGAEVWAAFLERITCGDKSLEEYNQTIAGMNAIGKALYEHLVIHYGGGRNGKSTYDNTIARVLGDYSGSLSAETLTVNCRKNKSPEYAELRGKRLVIAAELEEGTRLDTAIVKKLCSTDPIYAEKKYKDPFSFIPSHSTILYTNHLPRVGTSDAGTWRRLIVVPFNAVIEGGDDIKNYADYLFQNAGGAALAWIIEGARKFIASGYKIVTPDCVTRAIEAYRAANDWLNNYLSECCDKDPAYKEKSGELYAGYRAYCTRTGEYIRSAADFKAAIEGAGFNTKKTKTGVFIYGLRIQS